MARCYHGQCPHPYFATCPQCDTPLCRIHFSRHMAKIYEMVEEAFYLVLARRRATASTTRTT